MNIVLPIIFMAVAIGLFVPKRFERQAYWGMAVWIILIISRYYMKN